MMSQSNYLRPNAANMPNLAGATGSSVTDPVGGIHPHQAPQRPEANWNNIPTALQTKDYHELREALTDKAVVRTVIMAAMMRHKEKFLATVLPLQKHDGDSFDFSTVTLQGVPAVPVDPRGPVPILDVMREVRSGTLGMNGIGLTWLWQELQTPEGFEKAMLHLNALSQCLKYTMALSGVKAIMSTARSQIAGAIKARSVSSQEAMRWIRAEVQNWGYVQTNTRPWIKMKVDMLNTMSDGYQVLQGRGGFTASSPVAFITSPHVRRNELEASEKTVYYIAGPNDINSLNTANPYEDEKVVGTDIILVNQYEDLEGELGLMQQEAFIGSFVHHPCTLQHGDFQGFDSRMRSFSVYDEDQDRMVLVTYMDCLNNCHWCFDGHRGEDSGFFWGGNDAFSNDPFFKNIGTQTAPSYGPIQTMGDMLETGAATPAHFVKLAHSVLYRAFRERTQEILVSSSDVLSDGDEKCLKSLLATLGVPAASLKEEYSEVVLKLRGEKARPLLDPSEAEESSVRLDESEYAPAPVASSSLDSRRHRFFVGAPGDEGHGDYTSVDKAVAAAANKLRDATSINVVLYVAAAYAQVPFTHQSLAAALENNVFCMVDFLYVRPEAAYITDQV